MESVFPLIDTDTQLDFGMILCFRPHYALKGRKFEHMDITYKEFIQECNDNPFYIFYKLEKFA